MSTFQPYQCNDVLYRFVFSSWSYWKLSFYLSSCVLQSNVFMYYGLSNFYQNHRRYVKSRDDSQLNGDNGSLLVSK